MKIEATFKKDNVLEIEYDQEAQDAMLKAYCMVSIERAIQKEEIAKLEQRVKYWRRKYYKCKKSR